MNKLKNFFRKFNKPDKTERKYTYSYEISGENNHIVIFNDDGEIGALSKNISGLNISIKGNGNTIRIHEKAVFVDSYIQIGNNNVFVEINQSNLLSIYVRCCFGNNQNFKIGKNTEIGGVCFYLDEESACFIGEDCMFSNDINVWCGDGHAVLDKITREFLNEIKTPVKIGNHCWIGQGCRLLKGCGLADDCILGGRYCPN